MNKIKKDLTPYNIFTGLSLIGIILFFVFALICGAYAFDWICLRNASGEYFKDYFEHVAYVADPENLYSRATGEWGTFPPFVYIIYSFLFRIGARMGFVPDDRFELMESEYAFTVFLYYSLFVCLLLVYAISLWANGKRFKRLLCCLLLSVPFLGGGVERANSIMIVMPLILIALKWKESDSRLLREGALGLIAVCAGIKIYPAVLGVLYLRERRWKESLRLIAYGLAVFFVPFLFFGGAEAFSLWMGNMQSTLGSVMDVGRVEYIQGLACTIFYMITKTNSAYVSTVFPLVFFIVMISLTTISGNRYRVIFFICCLITFYPYNAHRYTLCYLAIPLIIYMMEEGYQVTTDKWISAEVLCYSMIFTIPTIYGMMTGFKFAFVQFYAYANGVEIWMYSFAYLLMLIVIAHEIVEIKTTGKMNPVLSQQVSLNLKMRRK